MSLEKGALGCGEPNPAPDRFPSFTVGGGVVHLGDGGVLVVEDDPLICTLIKDIVEGRSLEAVCVHSDADAYAALRTSANFRALVLDINLGRGTTGFDIARFARQLIPDVAVIYVSGEASDLSFRAFGVPDSTFLQKPFAPYLLLEVLRARVPA